MVILDGIVIFAAAVLGVHNAKTHQWGLFTLNALTVIGMLVAIVKRWKDA